MRDIQLFCSSSPFFAKVGAAIARNIYTYVIYIFLPLIYIHNLSISASDIYIYIIYQFVSRTYIYEYIIYQFLSDIYTCNTEIDGTCVHSKPNHGSAYMSLSLTANKTTSSRTAVWGGGLGIVRTQLRAPVKTLELYGIIVSSVLRQDLHLTTRPELSEQMM